MTDSLTQVLAHLRRLLADATPGPWRDPGNGNVVGPSGLITTVPRGKGAGASRRRDADAALICAAISHLPRLLAEVEEMRARIAGYEKWESSVNAALNSGDGSYRP